MTSPALSEAINKVMSAISDEEARLRAMSSELHASTLRLKEFAELERQAQARLAQLNADNKKATAQLATAEAEAGRLTKEAKARADRVTAEARDKAAQLLQAAQERVDQAANLIRLA